MKAAAIAIAVATLFIGAPAQSQGEQPEWAGQALFGASEYAKLEALVARYLKEDTRGDDGRHSLYLLTTGLTNSFQQWEEERDPMMAAKFREWEQEIPGSALQPVVAVIQMQASAWRARGGSYASDVSEEGWRLFKTRNQKAWKMLMDSKQRSSGIPTWYELAINIGGDIGLPDAALRELFDEGIKRHPGYYAIYFAYTRPISPRWGGTWASADKFILEQAAAKTNKEGDILYTRLYWLADQAAGGSQGFFKESLVKWPRMRRGFEQLMAAHPRGARNYASFAMFACRANDAATYARLRPKLDLDHFGDVTPHYLTVEVCDSRFASRVTPPPPPSRPPGPTGPSVRLPYMQSPGWAGAEHFRKGEFAQLETLVAGYMKSDARDADGRQMLYLVTTELSDTLGRDRAMDGDTTGKLAAWRKQFPQSALQPIVAAILIHKQAWRARGNGPDESVTAEGKKLFRDGNARALKILVDNKQQSSTLPSWYEYAILATSDAGMATPGTRALFDEGIRKFPGNQGIVYAQARHLSPLWSGSWKAVDSFIAEQASAKTNPLREILYANAYAYVDWLTGQPPDFFEATPVSWPRMRRGFEALIAKYPQGWRSHASFAVYACRAKDAGTYAKLRLRLNLAEFDRIAPGDLSVEVCDARFMKAA